MLSSLTDGGPDDEPSNYNYTSLGRGTSVRVERDVYFAFDRVFDETSSNLEVFSFTSVGDCCGQPKIAWPPTLIRSSWSFTYVYFSRLFS